jgi:hypothetical protein
MIAKRSCHEAEIETSCAEPVDFRRKAQDRLFPSSHPHGTKPRHGIGAEFASLPATSLAPARHIGKSLLNYTDQFNTLAVISSCRQ